jgi:hypothetical protein
MQDNKPKARLIAFYLPQYHPIPENDKAWGKGFTEWTNVKKAKPLFKGHYQPDLPSELGFYDLRNPDIREKQAKLAREAGIEGFCYWHYWFGNGKRALETIFDEVLKTGRPDFPFCLGWANESWTGKWHGLDKKIIIEQKYPGEEDFTAHFYTILDAFKDNRYICVDGKPIFVIFKPDLLPDPLFFSRLWRKLAKKEGLPGIYFISNKKFWNISIGEFNGFTAQRLFDNIDMSFKESQNNFIFRKLLNKFRFFHHKPICYSYDEYVDTYPVGMLKPEEYPTIFPNWDNTPRCGNNGVILINPTAQAFKRLVGKATTSLDNRDYEHRILFIKSWNEWAEGNYLEPSQRHGRAYLDVLNEAIIGA